jgi:REP element-mobilizing transposase RayT
MNRGVNRQPIFFGDADRVEFGRRLADLHEHFQVSTLAYCLMGNHYHLLLRAPTGNLAEAMHHLGSVYVRHTNDRVGRDGPLFRGRYHAIPVQSDEYFVWVARYIHRNAMEVPHVKNVADYRWSSYRAFLGHRAPARFLDLTTLLEHFGGSRQRLAEFTDEPGSPLPPVLTAAGLLDAIAFALADDDLRHGTAEDHSPWLGQTILNLLTEFEPAIAQLQGFDQLGDRPTDVARRMALSRARKRLASDERLHRVYTHVARALTLRHVA